MDSPLNRAHQQERRAEQLILSGNYLAAITCYEVAAGHITEAMKATSATQALISMQLQHEDHLRNQRILKEKIIHSQLQATKQSESNNADINDSHIKSNVLEKDEANNAKVETKPELKESMRDISFTSSLSTSSQIVISQNTEENLPREDLQMQVLSLTQALEDCNREKNHLRSIILKFKQVLETKFGLSADQIEEIIISQDSSENTDNKL